MDKAVWLAAYCKRKGWSGEQVLFFGDTQEDARAAKKAGCAFAWVGLHSRRGVGLEIRDFQELLRE